ncbi:MAG: hypothetical protein HFG95_11355 [Dorea sp.]|jgi:hypothetical protein|nr:hypothetical protein [Dorea sp.]
MRINSNQNVSAIFTGIRQSRNEKQINGQNSMGVNLPGNRDTVTISLFRQPGKSQIKNLMNQKQSLLDRKNELISAVCADGKSRESIQRLLDSYEEQIKTLDQQITQEMSRQNEKQIEKMQTDERNSVPKTKQEIENERLSNLMNLYSGLSQAGTIQSVQTRVEGEANILESEIELDKLLAGDSKSAKELIVKKEAELADLKQQSNELTAKFMENVTEVIEKAEESSEPVEVQSPEEEKKDIDVTDNNMEPIDGAETDSSGKQE